MAPIARATFSQVFRARFRRKLPKPVRSETETGAETVNGGFRKVHRRTEFYKNAKQAGRVASVKRQFFLPGAVKRRGNRVIIDLRKRIGTRIRKKKPNNPHPKMMDMEDVKKWLR